MLACAVASAASEPKEASGSDSVRLSVKKPWQIAIVGPIFAYKFSGPLLKAIACGRVPVLMWRRYFAARPRSWRPQSFRVRGVAAPVTGWS
ncbi:MAG: hypothetical protein RJA70_1526 [Pseudomonadota bacterium]|jgi:hypothetical protein